MKTLVKFGIFGAIVATMALSAPLGAQEVDWDNEKDTCEAPGAREAVPDMPPIPDVKSGVPKEFWTRKRGAR